MGNRRLEAAEAVCEWLANLNKMDMSPDLRGRALMDTGSKLISDWSATKYTPVYEADGFTKAEKFFGVASGGYDRRGFPLLGASSEE
jgi:hypothetical protein